MGSDKKGRLAAVISDDESFRRMLSHELTRLGFEVTGEESDTAAKKADFIFTDSEEPAKSPEYAEKTLLFTDSARVFHCFDVFPKTFSLSDLDFLAELHSGGVHPVRENTRTPVIKNNRVRIGETEIKLSPDEATVLKALSKAEGYVSRDDLNRLLGHEEKCGNLVDVYICRLRKKLEKALGYRVISTVRGVGYKSERKFEYEK